MNEDWTLFEMKESYSLVGLRDLCIRETKARLKPVEGEDLEEFNREISEEADLLFAERLRAIADDIERRILEPQRQMIRETYDGIFWKNK